MRGVILVLLPGIGLVQRGRPGRGVMHFLLFAFLVNVFFMAPFLLTGSALRIAAGLGAAGVWAWSARETLQSHV